MTVEIMYVGISHTPMAAHSSGYKNLRNTNLDRFIIANAYTKENYNTPYV